MRLLNPTVNIQAGDIARLPIAGNHSASFQKLVERAVILGKEKCTHMENTWDFVCPYLSLTGDSSPSVQQSALAALEAEIDTAASRLYGLSEEDLAAIGRELSSTVISIVDDDTEADSELGVAEEDAEAAGDLSLAEWARNWISYALGTVLGRFEIGQPSALGCGAFPETTVTEIRQLIDSDGIMPCDAGNAQDIAARTFACLELLLGPVPASDAIRSATDTYGDPVEALRGWLDRFTGTPEKSFWKYHHQLYRKRPVYWPFQSPQKTFTVWVYQEKIGPNTLHTIKELAEVRLNLLERSEIPPLRLAAATNRSKERELGTLLEKSDDLREFSVRLKQHIETGYQSCPDDGVILNAAPLHDLFPNWTDTKRAWEDLKAEDYEWAHQAMRHWPDRVTEACRSNRSFAIAHGLEHLCPAAPGRKGGRKGAV